MIRQRSPNGVGFANASDADIAIVGNRIDNYLRDIFCYDASAQNYRHEIKRING